VTTHYFPGIHIQLTEEDKPYFPSLRNMLQGRCRASINYDRIETAMDGMFRSQKNGHKTKLVISTSEKLLRLIRGDENASLDNYAGSIINYKGYSHLFIHPLKQLVTKSYGKFLTRRYLSKFLEPTKWLSIPDFKWELFDPSKLDTYKELSITSDILSADIETDYPEPTRGINCIALSFVRLLQTDRSDNVISVYTVVIPFEDMYHVEATRVLLSTGVPKVFQNGKFDISYLLRYGIIPINYLGDTINSFHAWYSELPKDLGLIVSFCLHTWPYHKDEISTGNLMDYYQYNAKDAFVTAMCFIVLMIEMPEFAIANYLMEFKVVVPCILSELTGWKIDVEEKDRLTKTLGERNLSTLNSLRVMVDDNNFNPKSWQQVVKLWKALGSEDITSSDDTAQDKVAARHPLNRRLTTGISIYRDGFDRVSKYTGKDFVWCNRCFYAINPHGTDTGRQASKASQFGGDKLKTGLQIQNVDPEVKSMFVADEGFYLGEADYKQNESWGQAYLSGDPNLIKAVEDKSRDFHGTNASSFFGVSYDTIINSRFHDDQWHHKTIDKELRDLSKRTNHGAAYNMAASVLLNTMGIENVLRAKILLKLPKNYTLLQVTQTLLDGFDKTFPIVRGKSYTNIKDEVRSTGQLVGPTGWTRVCFSDPSDNKRAMNMYAAHKPQSLAAMVLNTAYTRVFNEVWRNNTNDFKLLAQVHDSIIFQYRIGRDDLPRRVASCMDIHTNVMDIFGITHDLNVPVDLKGNGKRWSELESI
jgi:DNA polymerase I-like protein with 3'-5' exonuclease and polymerase domains